ncbi:MAG: hypothetical protein H7X75_10675 [Burkholderiaceae bacterium]|nr:hypothetical protein [Burkholderiaceae bacterium]
MLVCISISSPACTPTFNWREFRSPDGFVVLLPGRPQTVVRDTPLADTAVQLSMTSTGIGGTLFAVGSARLPRSLSDDAAQRQRALGSLRDALVRNVNGKIVKTSPATLPTSPGNARQVVAAEAIEAAGSDAKGRAVRLAARLFIVDDRLFQVVALGVEGEIPPDALDTFFASFRLIQ